MAKSKYGRKPVIAIDYKTNKRLKEYESVCAACKDLGLKDRSAVFKCLSGAYNHTHGYTFIYA